MALHYCEQCQSFQNVWHFAQTPHTYGKYPSRLPPGLSKSRKEQNEYIRELADDLHTIYLETKNIRKEIEYLQGIRSKAIKELEASGYRITTSPPAGSATSQKSTPKGT